VLRCQGIECQDEGKSSERSSLIHVRRSIVPYVEDRVGPARQLANRMVVCAGTGWVYELYEGSERHRSGRSEQRRPARRDLKR
jgi:hypothetical protein